jgi:hypothetical protein
MLKQKSWLNLPEETMSLFQGSDYRLTVETKEIGSDENPLLEDFEKNNRYDRRNGVHGNIFGWHLPF